MNAQTLKLIRQTLGLSQRELATQAGVSKALVGLIENEQRTMTPSVKSRILSVLGMTDEQIARYEEISKELMAI